MKPKKQTAPAVNPANENAAALAVIIGALGEAIENNREQKRFAADPEIYDTLANELKELNAALAWAKANAACPVKPANLAAVPIDDLILELHRRKDEVALIAVTPSDLSDYWGTDDNGNPLPTNQLPNGEAWSTAARAFNRCLDGGTFTEIMEAMGDAWAKTNETRRKEVSSYLEIPVNDEQKATGKKKGESK